jgi:L-ribulose-5-phosphate 3-epimerase
MNRRSFLAGVAVAVGTPVRAAERKQPGPICFFSKHLPKMAPGPMAKALRAVGYQGIELTVRGEGKGHVDPEKVETELPKAVEAIRAEGMQVPIIAPGLTDADAPLTKRVLATAGKLGIGFFRPGWFTYESADVRKELQRVGRAMAALAEAGKRAHIEMAYQNHVGKVGAPLWDLARLIEPLDRRWASVYFDICHGMSEGGAGSWKVGLQLLAARTKVFGVKDFYWDGKPGGPWTVKDCPLGQGMCALGPPLGILAKAGFAGPISVYQEYQKPSDSEDAIVAAAGRDAALLRASIAEAYGAGATP